MNALILINDSDQYDRLKVAFDAAMSQLNWEMIAGFETSYIKNFESRDPKEIEKNVQQDLDTAVLNADWKDLKYIMAILETSFKYMKS